MSDEVRQPRRSLQLRFVLLVALLMVGLAAMLGTATVATQRRNARAAVEDRVAAVGELVALDSSSRNDRSDAPSLRLLGEFLRDQPGAIGAYILAPDGEILAGGVDTVGLDLGATGQAFADPAGVVAQATIRANVGGAQAGTAVIGEFGGALHSAQAIMVDGQHVRTITFVTSLDEVGDATRTGILLVLAVSALFLLVGLTVTAVVMRRVTRRLTRLTDAAEELSEVRLPALVAQMQSDGAEPEVGGDPVVIDTDGGDEVARLAQAFAAMQITTEEVAHTQSELLKRGIGDIFVQLARRNQSLIDRQIEVIDVLEAGERSPDSLAGLFKLDHLAARMRRNAESLLVLAGESQTNVRARPSSLTDVIRVAIGEVEHYHRVEVEEVASMMVQGSAASGLAHLLAELLDNALRNAPEVTRVTVSASRRDDGTCSVEIVDQGVGMTSDQLTEYNTLLASPPPMGLSLDKALGFIVVGRLAQQFDAEVILRPGNHGGLVAHVLLPTSMLSEKRELRRSGDDEPVDPRPTSTAAVDPRPPSPASKRSEIAGLGEVAG
ncbi:MAG: HAMP domain-containing protein, partial [Acidimicrobiales bacterium]|nr:HAMP domain-containing protein [Acidimicrobiales bacterium]